MSEALAETGKAWRALVEALSRELPRNVHEQHLARCRPVLAEFHDPPGQLPQARVHLAAGDPASAEWLENRLERLCANRLSGLLGRETRLVFLPSGPEPVSAGLPAGPAAHLPFDDYEARVRPERVVAVPGSLVRLLPEIGPRNAWLYVAFRQAVWQPGDRESSSLRTRPIPVRRLLRFSGLSRRAFFRAAADPATWQALNGLVTRAGGESPGSPLRYQVSLTPPLAVSDRRALAAWFGAQRARGRSLSAALTEALAQPDPAILLSTPAEAASPPPAGVDLPGLLEGLHRSDLTPEDRAAARQLEGRLRTAWGLLLIPHYFLHTVIPRAGLTPAQAWLVALLRERCHPERGTSVAWIPGGMAALAGWLGLSRPKTVAEWLRGPLTPFVRILPPEPDDAPGALRLQVRREEPLFLDGNGTPGPAHTALPAGAGGIADWRQWHPMDL